MHRIEGAPSADHIVVFWRVPADDVVASSRFDRSDRSSSHDDGALMNGIVTGPPYMRRASQSSYFDRKPGTAPLTKTTSGGGSHRRNASLVAGIGPADFAVSPTPEDGESPLASHAVLSSYADTGRVRRRPLTSTRWHRSSVTGLEPEW